MINKLGFSHIEMFPGWMRWGSSRLRPTCPGYERHRCLHSLHWWGWLGLQEELPGMFCAWLFFIKPLLFLFLCSPAHFMDSTYCRPEPAQCWRLLQRPTPRTPSLARWPSELPSPTSRTLAPLGTYRVELSQSLSLQEVHAFLHCYSGQDKNLPI